jgi:hypothetical protein
LLRETTLAAIKVMETRVTPDHRHDGAALALAAAGPELVSDERGDGDHVQLSN